MLLSPTSSLRRAFGLHRCTSSFSPNSRLAAQPSRDVCQRNRRPGAFRQDPRAESSAAIDLLSNCIEIGLKKGHRVFDKYTLWALNYAAVSNISQFGGRYREKPIYVANHILPDFRVVLALMDRFSSVVHENWEIVDHPTVLPAYALWRLNWIHPFVEGNWRTARAACYYLLCLKQKRLLPGSKIGPS